MRRLRTPRRIDTLSNDIRAKQRGFGRIVYICMLATLVVWLVDYVTGELFYVRAAGQVIRQGVDVSAGFPATVVELKVAEGDVIDVGDTLARLESPELAAERLKLTNERATASARLEEAKERLAAIDRMLPLARERNQFLDQTRAESVAARAGGLITRDRQIQAVKDAYDGLEAVSRLEAEKAALAASLPGLTLDRDQGGTALAALDRRIAGGAVQAPTWGVIGQLNVRAGSETRPPQSLMTIYTGVPMVEAFLPSGTAYRIHEGDKVVIHRGFRSWGGTIADMRPLAAPVPNDLTRSFDPPRREQRVLIAFDEPLSAPVLFTHVGISGRYGLIGAYDWLIGRRLGQGPAKPAPAATPTPAPAHEAPPPHETVSTHPPAPAPEHGHADEQAHAPAHARGDIHASAAR